MKKKYINVSCGNCYTQELFVSYGYHNGEDSYEDFVKNEENYSPWYIQEFKKLTVEEAKTIWDYQLITWSFYL